MLSKTIAILKPDAVKRGLIGRIISEIEENDFEISFLRFGVLQKTCVERFYDRHRQEPYFPTLINFMTSGPSVIAEIGRYDNSAIENWRHLIGATRKENRLPHTIRYKWAQDTPIHENLVHGSDSTEEYQREWRVLWSYSIL